MSKRSRAHSSQILTFSLLAVLLVVFGAANVQAQALAPSSSGDGHGVLREPSGRTDSASEKKPETTEEKLSALEQMLLEQSQRLNQLQKTIAEQQETIQLLAKKLNATERSTEAAGLAGSGRPTDSAGAVGQAATQRVRGLISTVRSTLPSSAPKDSAAVVASQLVGALQLARALGDNAEGRGVLAATRRALLERYDLVSP